MKHRMVICFLFISFLFGGCHFQPKRNPQNRVVTKITVAYHNGEFTSQREYTDNEITRQILNYLRYIDPYGKPDEDPETVSGHEYRIYLSMGENDTLLYRQKDDRFFMGPDGNWQKISLSRGQKLGWLLWKIRSEESHISISP